jgi:signal transduction histidine kinase
VDFAQFSAHIVTTALPAIIFAATIILVLLAASFCALRWRLVASAFRRHLFRRRGYDYREIFLEYLDHLGGIAERRDMYPAILVAACRILGARGASLIVRDASGYFQMKASHGLRPFSFDVEPLIPFLCWLEDFRSVVTRQDFVTEKKLQAMKSDGIRYCVQFNAEACVPLFVGGKLYGVINLGERECGAYDVETRDLLRLLAVQFATAIHNANLYEALVKQNRDLHEASRLKTQLLANLSHELKTPLTGIIGLSELLAEGADGEVNAEQVEHLMMIHKSGVRLFDTMTAMLDISKLEVNRLDLDVQRVKLDRLVQDVAREIDFNRHTKFEVHINADTPGVYGDEKRLAQVVKQVLGNAAKFTKRGRVTVDAEKCGEMLKVTVKDTGIGIAPDRQKVIFDGFVQSDGSMTRGYEGLGLGLTISRKLVELHGGRMWLTSKPGKGSQFSFTLPLKPISIFGNGAVAH